MVVELPHDCDQLFRNESHVIPFVTNSICWVLLISHVKSTKGDNIFTDCGTRSNASNNVCFGTTRPVFKERL